MLNRRALLASSASAALLAASARQAAAQGSAADVKIGVIYPFTGSGAQVGVDARVALETAADVINERYEIDLPLALKPVCLVSAAPKSSWFMPTTRPIRKRAVPKPSD